MRHFFGLGLLAWLSAAAGAAPPELSLDEAVRRALAHNPDVRATLEEVGISQAEAAQAGLLKNPEIEAGVRFPLTQQSTSVTAYDVTLTQDILDIFLRGKRTELSGDRLEAARLRVARVVFQQSTMVKSAFWQLQADEQELALQSKMNQVAEAATDLSERQRQAGNLSELDLVRQQALAAESQAEVLRLQGMRALDQERLARLLGQGDEDFTVAQALAPLPGVEPELSHLEKVALARRSDIGAAQLDIQAAHKGGELASSWGGLDSMRVGVQAGRDIEGAQTLGPVVQLPIPLFDHHQAQQSRYQAEEKRASQRLEGTRQDALFQVRQSYRKLLTGRSLAQAFQDKVLPLRQRSVVLGQQQYNNMQLGVYGLLSIYREELESHKQAIEALRDYWIARAELEQAVGLELSQIDKEKF